MSVRYYAMFERFDIALEKEHAQAGCQPGARDADIAQLRRVPYIREQLDALDRESVRNELRDYGAWTSDELADDEENLSRILWIACCNVKEDLE